MGELDFVQDLAVVTFCAGIAGFLCQKIGLSSVVGFMLAGLLVGPHTPPFSIVVDENRIETLSQLGSGIPDVFHRTRSKRRQAAADGDRYHPGGSSRRRAGL